MQLTVELETEEGRHWIAEVPEFPGTLVYGTTREDALALQVLADKLEHGEAPVELMDVAFVLAA